MIAMGRRLTRMSVRLMDRLARLLLRPQSAPASQTTGATGEEEAYFFLREQGYVMVARNHRTRTQKGEIDLIGWDGDVLCFVEVKTRTTHAVKPAEAAVDSAKQRNVQRVAWEYLRRMSGTPQWRFDIVSVYVEPGRRPEITVFRNAFSLA
jgi:putative endonuclease